MAKIMSVDEHLENLKNKKNSVSGVWELDKYESSPITSVKNKKNIGSTMPPLPSTSSTKSAKKKLKAAEKEYQKIADIHGKGYQEWSKKVHKDDNLLEKGLNVLDSFFWGGDKRYYNEKYTDKALYEAHKNVLKAQDEYDQSIVDSQENSSLPKQIVMPFVAGIDKGVSSINAGINKLGSYIPTQSIKNYNYSPSILQKQHAKIREETENPIMSVYQDLAYTTGNMVPSMLMPNSKAATAMTALTSFGGAYNDAKSEGKEEKEATTYGILNSISETTTNKLLGGFSKIYGKSKLSKSLSNNVNHALSRVIKSDTIKSMISDMGSEAVEEYLQETLSPVIRNISFNEDNKLQLVSSEQLYSAFLGALSSGVTNSAYLLTNRKNTNQLQTDEINNSNIQNSIPNSQSPQNLSLDESNYSASTFNETNQNNINILKEQKVPQTSLNQLQTKTIFDKYKYELSDNQKINNLNESASKYFNNSNETKNMLSSMSKIISDKNYNVIFDDTISNINNGNQINAQIKMLENGETEIRINPNSNRAGEFLIMHEVSHAIETEPMKQLIIDYANKNTEFNQALESLKNTYGVNDVSSEVVADISGQLFGNQEFINNLSLEKPSVFKRIYNKIVELANKITGNSKESLFIKDLKNKWEQAYRTQNNNLSDTRYMMTGIKGMNNAIKQDSENSWLKPNYQNAKNMDKQGVSRDEIRTKTGWFKDKNGAWKFEISDENAHLKIKPSQNGNYELSDILVHEDLFELYPKLKKSKIKFRTLEDGVTKKGEKYTKYGYFSKLTNTIVINNKIISSPQKLLTTLLHETQHRIQKIEGFQGGASIRNSLSAYKNNFGEMEARDTTARKNMSYQERMKNKPISYAQKKANKNIAPFSKKTYNLFKENDLYVENSEKIPKRNLLPVYSGGSFSDAGGGNRRGREYASIQRISPRQITNSKETITRPKRISEKKSVERNSFSMQENNEWQEYLENNYKTSGTRTNMQDIKQKAITTTEDKLIERKRQKIEKKYEKEKQELKKKMSKEAARILEFSDYKTKHKFQEIISDFYDNPNFEDIKQSIKTNFGEQIIEYTNEETKNIKTEIRSTKLKVTSDIKKGIVDYETFRRSNFNKLKLTNEGQSIDSFYKELSEIYPNIFKDDVINPVDQLKRLSEFMDEDVKIMEKYKLDDNAINDATKYIYDALKSNVRIDDLLDTISISPKEIRKEKTYEYREYAQNFLENSSDWQDKNIGIKYKTNTMKRNFYDIMSKEDASRMYSSFIQPIFEHNSQMQKDITSYNERIKKLNLNEKESTAVQMLGEYKYNPETLLTGLQVNDFIEKNKLDYNKIKNSVEVFRDTYDKLFERVNQALKSQGYKELEYRKGYFPHFTEEHAESRFGKMLEKMGWKFQKNEIPTSIAGITETFKPGKVWTSFSQQRKGKITDYNALQGFDNYIRGAMETIYFTEDIQKLRALENEIRYQHSEKGVQKQIDEIQADNELSFDEKQEKIDKIFATYITPLNNLVSEIRDYTNGIARKKSGLDRTMEQLTNREVYSVMTNVSNRLSANMVGLNFSSAITNFIPITQATSQVETKYLARGLKEAIKNQHTDDGFESKSVFLTSRLNAAENLYKTKLEKVSEKANFMFEGIDSITSNAIVRGKYYQNISKGMSEFNAIRDADEFARDLIAGRTKGEMPTAFNSKNPLIRIFTAFQLEVNNQYGYMFKDIPRDLKEEGLNKLIGAFFKMFVGAWLYNQFTERVVGRKSAFSPVDTITEVFSTTTNDNLKTTEKSANILENLTQDIPFVGGLIGGGRLPISSIANPLNIAKGESTLKDETKKALYYTVMPFGGGQLKKTIEGVSMYAHKKPGSYTSSGKLRFETKTDPLSVTKNVLFGQYSSKEAREYFENNYAPLTEKQVKEINKLGIPVSTYRKYQKDYSTIYKIKGDKDSDGKTIKGSASGKRAYSIMNNEKIDSKEKDYLLGKLSNGKNVVTSSQLKNIANDEEVYQTFFKLNSDGKKEFIHAIKNEGLTSYQLVEFDKIKTEYQKTYVNLKAKELITNYLLESSMTSKQKYYLYSKEYASDETIDLLNSFKVDANNYLNTINYVNNIKSSYQGEQYKNYRRTKIFQYINSLKASALEKAILFKQAGYSITNYKSSMYHYIENLSLTKEKKEKLWQQLY